MLEVNRNWHTDLSVLSQKSSTVSESSQLTGFNQGDLPYLNIA